MLKDETTYEMCSITVDQLRKKVLKFLKDSLNEFGPNLFTKKEHAALTSENIAFAYFYGLPKIHKSKEISNAVLQQNSEIITYPSPQDLTFRPIVSTNRCPTGPLSTLIDTLLRPFLNQIPQRLRDTWDFLKRLPSTTEEDTILVTADIASLYTNISNAPGIEAVNYFCSRYPELLPQRFPKAFLLKALEFCQANLYFTFREGRYRQLRGCGMGRKYSGPYSDLKVAYNETFLKNALQSRSISMNAIEYLLNCFFRYLDDVFFMWRHSFGNINIIEEALNSLDPMLRYEFNTSINNNYIPFLDVKVIINKGKISTDIYHKPTDSFNYLPFNSCHPRHTKTNIPFSLASRICGIISDNVLKTTRLQEMKICLLNKNYPPYIIDKGISRALKLNRDDIINSKTTQDPNSQPKISLTTTFNPRLINPHDDITRTINSYKASCTFLQKIKITNGTRQPPNLKRTFNHKNKAASPICNNTLRSVQKCSRSRCKLCPQIIEGSSYTFHNGKQAWCNAEITCYTPNVIYAMICTACNKFYIGETGDPICIRTTGHRQQIKPSAKDRPVAADIHIEQCSQGDFKMFPFFQPSRNETHLRRHLESLMIHKLQPDLNEEP